MTVLVPSRTRSPSRGRDDFSGVEIVADGGPARKRQAEEHEVSVRPGQSRGRVVVGRQAEGGAVARRIMQELRPEAVPAGLAMDVEIDARVQGAPEVETAVGADPARGDVREAGFRSVPGADRLRQSPSPSSSRARPSARLPAVKRAGARRLRPRSRHWGETISFGQASSMPWGAFRDSRTRASLRPLCPVRNRRPAAAGPDENVPSRRAGRHGGNGPLRARAFRASAISSASC